MLRPYGSCCGKTFVGEESGSKLPHPTESRRGSIWSAAACRRFRGHMTGKSEADREFWSRAPKACRNIFGSLEGRGFSRDIKNASDNFSFRRTFRRAFRSIHAPLLAISGRLAQPATRASLRIKLYAPRIGAGGTTTSTSPVPTSYTSPDISHAPGNAGIARSAATSTATAARGSVTAFVLSSPSCI
jgi:hypothetical protein